MVRVWFSPRVNSDQHDLFHWSGSAWDRELAWTMVFVTPLLLGMVALVVFLDHSLWRMLVMAVLVTAMSLLLGTQVLRLGFFGHSWTYSTSLETEKVQKSLEAALEGMEVNMGGEIHRVVITPYWRIRIHASAADRTEIQVRPGPAILDRPDVRPLLGSIHLLMVAELGPEKESR